MLRDLHRVAEFQEGVGLAIDYAITLGCGRLNCLAGIPPDGVPVERAREILVENLRFAAAVSKRAGIQLLIEPLNTRDTPGFLVPTTRDALALIAEVGGDNLRVQYDIYHAQIMEGDVIRTIQESHAYIGHYHTAGNPGRNEIDDTQELNYPAIMRAIKATGFTGFVAQEFIPKRTPPLDSLRAAVQLCRV